MFSPEGKPLKSVELGKAFSALRQEGPAIMSHPFLIHRESGRLWLFAGSDLFQIEESSGFLLKRVKLPRRALSRRDDRSDFDVAEGGFFHHDGRSLYFMDWEGRLRRLGKA
jgi:hypothetical protein